MNDDILEGQWLQLHGRIKAVWGDLTDDEIEMIAGRRDRLAGKLQERYGWSNIEADEEIDRFIKRISAEGDISGGSGDY